jgi:ATP-dependent DNA ligase
MNKKSLYQKGKKNEIRIWSVWTENDNIYTEFGVLDGEMQVSVKKAQAKNVGKSNETSAIQQAEIEAEALYVFKRDRKYFETKEEAEKGVVILPMLAKEIDKKKIIYPCLVQPKLDGVRCLAYWENDKIKLLSRGGKEWTIKAQLRPP